MKFTAYQKGVIALLAVIQFTIILDFMVLAPLGDILMKSMSLDEKQFALVVSAYAFSAGICGVLAAGFADKYDRKKLLLLFYVGFTLGTLLCAVASSYYLLLFGRVVTGMFSGVLGAVSMAIIADLFAFEQRGRVMGFVQMSFAVSQVLGLPVGLWLATRFDWHAPFAMIVPVCLITAVVIFYFLKPVSKHIGQGEQRRPLPHLVQTSLNKSYRLPFITTALLSIGGFMLMPFSTPFLINNVGVSQDDLPTIYFVMGISSMVMLPLIGKLSDKVGKLPTFIFGSVLASIMVIVYTNLTPVPLWLVILISAIMFAGVMSRMIPSTALMTAVPKAEDRGAFMSINSSLQQIAGGIAAVVAGQVIVVQAVTKKLYHFDTLGYLCVGVMIVCGFCVYVINKRVMMQQNIGQLADQPASDETVVPVAASADD